jgi:hypothetical protein
MKNNWIRRNVTVILIACVMWSFFVMLAIRAHAETGPFCSLCQLVTLEHMTREEYDLMMSNVNSWLPAVRAQAQYMVDTQVSAEANLQNVYMIVFDWLSNGVINENQYNDIITQLDSFSSFTDTASILNDINNALFTIENTINDPVFTTSEFCITCTASGEGGGTGEGDCCCNCPDYGPILQEMSDRIASQTQSLLDMKSYLLSIQTTLDSWYIRWKAQDDKLLPILDELSPWLEKSKKFYTDYYDADWGSATWSNLKNIISDMTQKETITKLDRVLSDYVGSSMSSSSWSSLDYCLGVQKDIYDYAISDTDGKGVIKNILKDYGDSVEFPVGQSYTYPSEIPDEKEWMELNWFQRITAALGVIAFSDTNIAGRVDMDFEEQQQKVEGVLTAVGGFGDGLKTEINGFYTSYSGLFTTFSGLFPKDQFPTSLRLHPGFKFEYNPTGEAGGGQSNYVLPPWDWMLSETPLFKTAMDMARAIFGLCWWLLGAGILYEVIHGVYSMVVGLVGRVLVVVGSMGRSGGAGLGGD